jgi:hypothetical protein
MAFPFLLLGILTMTDKLKGSVVTAFTMEKES